MPGRQSIEEYVDFALAVLDRAGALALKHFRTALEVSDKGGKSGFDPVTAADREVEEFIRAAIRESWPEHGIIGEEYGAEAEHNATVWVIDPLDGTRGFLAGTPMWGILLGLVADGRCVAGFMRQPLVGETWFGSGSGAWLVNGAGRRRLETRSTRDIGEAILCCTHPGMFHNSVQRAAFDRVDAACRFSRFGTDCYGYCLLAGGFVDLVVEADLAAYDILPMIPIVEAAGGVITDWDGKPPLNGGSVVAAANAELHARALELLHAPG
jgi:histidinol phosphatase-like enzyme (inositol monophosphatase family)